MSASQTKPNFSSRLPGFKGHGGRYSEVHAQPRQEPVGPDKVADPVERLAIIRKAVAKHVRPREMEIMSLFDKRLKTDL